MRPSKNDLIFEAERISRESSSIWIRNEIAKFKEQQGRSLEPETYDGVIADLQKRLDDPNSELIQALRVYLLKEKGKWTWQKIGNYIFRSVASESARKERARRAWRKANNELVQRSTNS